MPTIAISEFMGIIPRAYPTGLPDGCAVRAHNCTLYNGKMTPLHQPSVATVPIRFENALSKLDDAKTIYLWRHGAYAEMLAWPGLVTVAESNIADDERSRIFIAGETGVGGTLNYPAVFFVTENGLSYERRQINKPVMPPVTLVGYSAPESDPNLRYTRFFQTWVDDLGYMSGPSEPSEEFTYVDGQTLTAKNLSSSEIQAYPSIYSRRFWKVVTGAETQNIQFVGEQLVTTLEGTSYKYFPDYEISTADEDAGEILPEFESAPADLKWMTSVPGNFYAGFSAASPKTVMFTEQGYATTWPLDYRYDIRDTIVGLAVCGNSVVALTTGNPWLLTGTAPGSMSSSVMQSEQACVSSRSICVMDGSVFYVSSDGICMVSPSGDYPMIVKNVTEKLFGKREWAALNPSSCFMQPYDGALHAWFTTLAGVNLGYVFKFSDGAAAVTTHEEAAKAACYDTDTGGLYYVRNV